MIVYQLELKSKLRLMCEGGYLLMVSQEAKDIVCSIKIDSCIWFLFFSKYY